MDVSYIQGIVLLFTLRNLEEQSKFVLVIMALIFLKSYVLDIKYGIDKSICRVFCIIIIGDKTTTYFCNPSSHRFAFYTIKKCCAVSYD